jgi:muramoyltetrapeptide carboxypeptidase
MPTLPDRLRLGDTVTLLAPASAPPDPKAVDQSVAVLETMGFRVKLGRNTRKRWGYLAGPDRERADDLMRAFADPAVKAVFCLRGGYGTARLLPLLDYQCIRANPKILVGYSDITSLICALLTRSRLLSFHGPMPGSDFLRKDCSDFSRDGWLRVLMDAKPAGGIRRGYSGKTIEILRRGRVSGQLIGGNLAVLCSTIGTAIQPSFENKILFFEDVAEKPYRFDRMLTHLTNAGVLQKVAGIAVGVCPDCDESIPKGAGEYRQSLRDVLRDRLLPLKIPVVIGLPFGHGPYNATLPVGGPATLDAEQGDLIFTSPAVR